MTIADFLSDRLGRIVLQGGCAAASALFLLATGTQPGVVALLLMGLILVFVLAQLWECVRLRRRLAELKAIMEELADQALQSHRALLIQSGVRVETRDLDQRVYTDGKWVCFLLGQLLQNAARYRSAQPVVTLSARALGRRVELTVEDNGIGIPAHELPRIFDRGFTGSNGRSRGGSTGMGLYLARRLATALEVELRAASEEGKGTRMTLLFPARENLSKL